MYIAYYRVSTKKQGESGLGLEAQEAAVKAFCGEKPILAAYTEVESGKDCDRPQLTEALGHAKAANAILVVAKLDRLSRNVAFVCTLMDSGVKFVCCDNPHANELTIQILAAMAQHEAKMISERTKAGLAAAKARGVLLGSARKNHWEGRKLLRKAGGLKGSRIAVARRPQQVRERYAHIQPLIRKKRAEGMPLELIADWLNIHGYRGARGAMWSYERVYTVDRMELDDG